MENIAIAIIGVGSIGFLVNLAGSLNSKNWAMDLMKLVFYSLALVVAAITVHLGIEIAVAESMADGILHALELIYRIIMTINWGWFIAIFLAIILRVFNPDLFKRAFNGKKAKDN